MAKPKLAPVDGLTLPPHLKPPEVSVAPVGLSPGIVDLLKRDAELVMRDPRGPHTPAWCNWSDADVVWRLCAEWEAMRREVAAKRAAMDAAVEVPLRGDRSTCVPRGS